MRVTVVSFKGGVGKTTTAVHLAAYLQTKGQTVLLDGDPNHSATQWAAAGSLPFAITDDPEAVRGYQHLMVDTQARPVEADLKALSERCDLLVIPSTPDAMSLRALMTTLQDLTRLRVSRYKVLLTIIPPRPSRDGDEARAMLGENGIPVFRASVRRLAAFQKAALAGVLVNEVSDPRAELGWSDYIAVGKEMMR